MLDLAAQLARRLFLERAEFERTGKTFLWAEHAQMSFRFLGRIAIGIGGGGKHETQSVLIAAAGQPAHAVIELAWTVADEIG